MALDLASLHSAYQTLAMRGVKGFCQWGRDLLGAAYLSLETHFSTLATVLLSLLIQHPK